jgi:hypothetical protein
MLFQLAPVVVMIGISSISLRFANILRVSSIVQILRTVVMANVVRMAYLVTFWTTPVKGFCH